MDSNMFLCFHERIWIWIYIVHLYMSLFMEVLRSHCPELTDWIFSENNAIVNTNVHRLMAFCKFKGHIFKSIIYLYFKNIHIYCAWMTFFSCESMFRIIVICYCLLLVYWLIDGVLASTWTFLAVLMTVFFFFFTSGDQ